MIARQVQCKCNAGETYARGKSITILGTFFSRSGGHDWSGHDSLRKYSTPLCPRPCPLALPLLVSEPCFRWAAYLTVELRDVCTRAEARPNGPFPYTHTHARGSPRFSARRHAEIVPGRVKWRNDRSRRRTMHSRVAEQTATIHTELYAARSGPARLSSPLIRRNTFA